MAAGFRVIGADRMLVNLRKLQKDSPHEFGRALRVETEVEATESKRRTPVDTGALRSTIHAEGPEYRGSTVVTAISAGGPSARYALIVHEDLEAHHPVGQAKYIESTLNESAPFIGARVARRIDLGKVVR